MYFSRISLAAEEVLPLATLALALSPGLASGLGVRPSAGAASMTVLPVGMPWLSTALSPGLGPRSSPTERSIAAAASSSDGGEALLAGIGVRLSTAGLVSRTTRN